MTFNNLIIISFKSNKTPLKILWYCLSRRGKIIPVHDPQNQLLSFSKIDLFEGREIERDPSFKEHLNRYDVIFLNMQQFLIRAKKQDATDYLEQEVLEELLEEYGDFIRNPEIVAFRSEYVLGIFNDRSRVL